MLLSQVEHLESMLLRPRPLRVFSMEELGMLGNACVDARTSFSSFECRTLEKRTIAEEILISWHAFSWKKSVHTLGSFICCQNC